MGMPDMGGDMGDQVHVSFPGARTPFVFMVAAPDFFWLGPAKVPVGVTSCAIEVPVVHRHDSLLVDDLWGCWHRYRDPLFDNMRLARCGDLDVLVLLHRMVSIAGRTAHHDLDWFGGHWIRYILGHCEVFILRGFDVDVLRHQFHVRHRDVLVMVHHFHLTGSPAQVTAETLMPKWPILLPVIKALVTVIWLFAWLDDSVINNLRHWIWRFDIDLLGHPVNAGDIVILRDAVDGWSCSVVMVHFAANVHLGAAKRLFPRLRGAS